MAEALEALEGELEGDGRGRAAAQGRRRLRAGGGPEAEDAARRLLAKPRTPPLTQAQAEVLAIVAYLQPVSRPEVARIRGVSSDSAVASLTERGMIEEQGRSRFGAVTYATTTLFEKLFGLSGLDALPDPSQFDPTPEDERELRERLLKAGEQRSGVSRGPAGSRPRRRGRALALPRSPPTRSALGRSAATTRDVEVVGAVGAGQDDQGDAPRRPRRRAGGAGGRRHPRRRARGAAGDAGREARWGDVEGAQVWVIDALNPDGLEARHAARTRTGWT